MEYLGIIEYRFLTDLRDANSEAFCCSHAGLFGGYSKSNIYILILCQIQYEIICGSSQMDCMRQEFTPKMV